MKNKNKSNFCIAVVFAAVLSVLMSSSAYGWGKGTHAKLTEQVIKNFQKTGWLVSHFSPDHKSGAAGVSRGRIGACLGAGRWEQYCVFVEGSARVHSLCACFLTSMTCNI